MTPWLVGFAAYIGTADLPLDTGETAIARTKTVLKTFEIPEPYRLAGLVKRPSEGFDPGGWTVVLQTAARRYRVVFGPNGRVRYADRPDDIGGRIDNPRDSKTVDRVTRWLKGYGPAFPIQPAYGKDEFSIFFFAGLVKGLPVVYPRTRLGYTIILKDGELHEFGAHEDVPAVPSPIPKLKEGDALEALARIFPADNPPKDGWTFSYRLYGRRELGWVVPKGGGPVRLAWRVPFMFERTSRSRRQGGSNGMLIDAETGRKIPTDTIP